MDEIRVRRARGATVLAIVALLALTARITPAQTTPTTPLAPPVMALVKTFPDGRVTWEIANTRRRSSWTPVFLRIEGWKPPAGAPQTGAVQFAHTLSGRDIHVDVSVLDPTHQVETPVVSVVVAPGAHILVEALRRFGVQPIELSTTLVLPMTPYPPTVVSVTPEIEIASVDVMPVPTPGYKVTLRNTSSKSVASFQVQSWRGDRLALSSMPRGTEGRPAMTPGGSHTFTVSIGSGGNLSPHEPLPANGVSPFPIDVIEIDFVRWEDGTTDGTMPNPSAGAAFPADAGRALQLERIVAIFEQAQQQRSGWLEILVDLRARLSALAEGEPSQLEAAQESMRLMKAAALDDLRRYEAIAGLAHSVDDVQEWLHFTRVRYELWLHRARHEPQRRP